MHESLNHLIIPFFSSFQKLLHSLNYSFDVRYRTYFGNIADSFIQYPISDFKKSIIYKTLSKILPIEPTVLSTNLEFLHFYTFFIRNIFFIPENDRHAR